MTATIAKTNGHPLTPNFDLFRLADKFPARDIEWRLQSCGANREGRVWGKVLAYVTNRAIMSRLDDVCGPAHWRNEFREWKGKGVLCGLSVRVGGEWVTKWDGAEDTDIEEIKGGLSGSMKRAAVQWGIGRYLYDLDEGWAQIVEKGEHYGKTKEGKSFQWNPPPLPAWALPDNSPPPPDDSIEANRASRSERADTRQAHPQPAPTVYCSQQQLDAIRDIMDEIGLSGPDRLPSSYGFQVKRPTHLTPEDADQLLLKMAIRRTTQLLTDLGFSLDDVRVEAPLVTADTPDELDAEQAQVALKVLRDAQTRALVGPFEPESANRG